jgi:transposase
MVWRISRMSRKQKHPVSLSAQERAQLERFIAKGNPSARAALHARVLLRADHGPAGPSCANAVIAESLGCCEQTVTRVRARFAEGGLERALHRKKQERHKPRKLDGRQEAHLIALACSEAPEGRCAWALRLLATRMVALGHVDSISHETVRQTLKRGRSSPG